MNRDKLIRLINKEMPEAKAVESEDFNGSSGGIWFRGSEDWHDDEPIFNAYCEPTMCQTNCLGVHVKLDAILDEHGWHAEPYDSGTLFAWK